MDSTATTKVRTDVSFLVVTYTGQRKWPRRGGLKKEAQASHTTEHDAWKKAVSVFMLDVNVHFKGEENNTKSEEWFP